MSPLGQDKWSSQATLTMMNARNLMREMRAKVRQNEIEEASNRNAMLEQAHRELLAKKTRVYSQAKTHGQVINTSFKCMQDIEDAILQTEASLSKLTHERYAGFAALQVCERRMELRKRRPPPELVRDQLSDALDCEHRLLEGNRKEFLQMEDDGRKIVDDLNNMRAFLSKDTGERRLEMMHDLTSLRVQLTLPPLQVKAAEASAPAPSSEPQSLEATLPAPQEEIFPTAAPPSPAAGSSTPAPAAAATSAAESMRRAEASELVKATTDLLNRSAQFSQKTAMLLDRSKEESKIARARTEDCLARRTTSLLELKRQLEQHVLDVEATIVTAERTITRTERRINPRDKARVDRLEQDKAALEKLRATRSALQQEIRNKFIALEIDNMCRRVTPAKASETRPPSRSVARSSSAPTLQVRKENSSSSMDFGLAEAAMLDATRTPLSPKPGSPPGASKALAAAAMQSLQS